MLIYDASQLFCLRNGLLNRRNNGFLKLKLYIASPAKQRYVLYLKEKD